MSDRQSSARLRGSPHNSLALAVIIAISFTELQVDVSRCQCR